jgi:hypothetical protein
MGRLPAITMNNADLLQAIGKLRGGSRWGDHSCILWGDDTEARMVEHLEDIPKGRGFPTLEEMKRGQAAFDALVPGGNASELVGFKIVDTGELMAICRRKRDALESQGESADLIGNRTALTARFEQ